VTSDSGVARLSHELPQKSALSVEEHTEGPTGREVGFDNFKGSHGRSPKSKTMPRPIDLIQPSGDFAPTEAVDGQEHEDRPVADIAGACGASTGNESANIFPAQCVRK
jgi:hypothetical protein